MVIMDGDPSTAQGRNSSQGMSLSQTKPKTQATLSTAWARSKPAQDGRCPSQKVHCPICTELVDPARMSAHIDIRHPEPAPKRPRLPASPLEAVADRAFGGAPPLDRGRHVEGAALDGGVQHASPQPTSVEMCQEPPAVTKSPDRQALRRKLHIPKSKGGHQPAVLPDQCNAPHHALREGSPMKGTLGLCHVATGRTLDSSQVTAAVEGHKKAMASMAALVLALPSAPLLLKRNTLVAAEDLAPRTAPELKVWESNAWGNFCESLTRAASGLLPAQPQSPCVSDVPLRDDQGVAPLPTPPRLPLMSGSRCRLLLNRPLQQEASLAPPLAGEVPPFPPKATGVGEPKGTTTSAPAPRWLAPAEAPRAHRLHVDHHQHAGPGLPSALQPFRKGEQGDVARQCPADGTTICSIEQRTPRHTEGTSSQRTALHPRLQPRDGGRVAGQFNCQAGGCVQEVRDSSAMQFATAAHCPVPVSVVTHNQSRQCPPSEARVASAAPPQHGGHSSVHEPHIKVNFFPRPACSSVAHRDVAGPHPQGASTPSLDAYRQLAANGIMPLPETSGEASLRGDQKSPGTVRREPLRETGVVAAKQQGPPALQLPANAVSSSGRHAARTGCAAKRGAAPGDGDAARARWASKLQISGKTACSPPKPGLPAGGGGQTSRSAPRGRPQATDTTGRGVKRPAKSGGGLRGVPPSADANLTAGSNTKGGPASTSTSMATKYGVSADDAARGCSVGGGGIGLIGSGDRGIAPPPRIKTGPSSLSCELGGGSAAGRTAPPSDASDQKSSLQAWYQTSLSLNAKCACHV